jgi:Bacterial archaeo-eukaryotic release factor family 2
MTGTLSTIDHHTIRDLISGTDPLATVYFGLWPSSGDADASEDLLLRWRAISADLRAGGADASTVDEVGRYITALPAYPAELAVFASGGQILLAQPLSGIGPYDRAAFIAPAPVAPLLAWLQRHPPYVQVTIDRAGAEIAAVPHGATAGSTRTVVGPDDEIERNAPGGWSQPRYHRRAEDSWRHNAAVVADAVRHELHRVHADLLLVAGDVRAVGLLEERLSRSHENLTVRHLPGGRSADGSRHSRWEAAAEAREAFATAQTGRLLALLASASGPGGRAVEGAQTILSALAAGRVDVLFVADDPGDERTAWFGPRPWCAAERPEGADAGLWRPGRLVDVAIRAALLADAQVRVLDSQQTQGIDGSLAALCRYA